MRMIKCMTYFFFLNAFCRWHILKYSLKFFCVRSKQSRLLKFLHACLFHLLTITLREAFCCLPLLKCSFLLVNSLTFSNAHLKCRIQNTNLFCLCSVEISLTLQKLILELSFKLPIIPVIVKIHRISSCVFQTLNVKIHIWQMNEHKKKATLKNTVWWIKYHKLKTQISVFCCNTRRG